FLMNMKTFVIITHVRLVLVFLFYGVGTIVQAQDKNPLANEKYDGPYLFYKSDSVKILSVQFGNNEIFLLEDSFPAHKLESRKIKVKPNASMPAFQVKLFKYDTDSTYLPTPGKIFLVSDIEGNLKDFVDILKVAGVINKKYEWTFGANYLVINGDLFDRGNDVAAFLWLCYKLDGESRLSGGKVLINLGNHDIMNLRGNTNYVIDKYLYLAHALGVNYKTFYDQNTELGRWLRTKNTITVIDSTAFVHAGLSYELTFANADFELINNSVRENIDIPDSLMENLPKYLFGNFGPFWYRGLVFNNLKFRPISEEKLNKVLDYFKVKRIIVGHSIVPEIVGLHSGKVIAVDVNHYENRENKRARGLLITNGKYYTVNDDGNINELKIVDGFNQKITEQY
ncbi:MAG: metallophosphoesterase, partial [Bacteroidales bacterium]